MKIHPSSLRIGNYVDLYINNTLVKETHKIVAEDFKHIEALCLVGFKPIYLTDKLLIGFGIKKDELMYNYFELSGLEFTKANKYFQLICENQILSKPIKHIHQLQNLYFALTEKELTLEK